MGPAAEIIDKHWDQMATDQGLFLASVEANVIRSVDVIYPKLSSKYHLEDLGKMVMFLVLMLGQMISVPLCLTKRDFKRLFMLSSEASPLHFRNFIGSIVNKPCTLRTTPPSWI